MFVNINHISDGKRKPYLRVSNGEGLREGDPLFPFLFLLTAEEFNIMMDKCVRKKLFGGYEFGRGEIKVSHIQYAADTIIMGKKSWSNVRVIKATL